MLAVSLVADLVPGPGHSSVNSLVSYNDVLFFAADDGNAGMELWKTDGTAGGTVMVKDINPAGASGPFSFVEVPLVYDGNKTRTVLFFQADDGEHGYELWISDGTEQGTSMVADLRPGIDPNTMLPYSSTISNMTRVGGTLYFTADNGDSGTELFRTNTANDGSVSVSLVADISPGVDPNSMLPRSSFPSSLTSLGNLLLFSAETEANGRELWKSDGTAGGTSIVLDLRPGNLPGDPPGPACSSNPSYLVRSGGYVYFSAYSLDTVGTELYRSDGTAAGTELVADIHPGFTVDENNSIFPNESWPQWITDVNGTLFFSAFTMADGRELWRSDGAPGGVTALVTDLAPGDTSGFPNSSSPGQLRNVRGTLFFTAGNDLVGQELFKSDGSAAGTTLVADIFPGATAGIPNSSDPQLFSFESRDQLYFSAFRDTTGRELYRTSIDPMTDQYVVNLEENLTPDADEMMPREGAAANGLYYFSGRTAANGIELFKLAPQQPAVAAPVAFDGTSKPAIAANANPADPHGAVGPAHVMSVVNRQVVWYDKSGAQQGNAPSLNDFFANANPAPGASLLFDPKIIYNTYTCTFFVVALWRSGANSRIYLAESDDHDPNGKWHFRVINATPEMAGSIDYPGLGAGKDAVYVTARTSGGTQRLWIVDTRRPLTAGNAAAVPPVPATPVTSHNLSLGAAAGSDVFMPAQMYGTIRDGVGTFLATFRANVGGADDHLYVLRVDNPLTAPALTISDLNLGDITQGGMTFTAPQAGAVGVDARAFGDNVYNAVWRNNALWTSNTILPTTGDDLGQATVRWYKTDTTNLAALSVALQGNVGGEDLGVGTHTFYPSIMVDSGGNMGVGFAASSPSLFPGAYFTGRRPDDPVVGGIGSTRAARIMQRGLDYYVMANPPAPNRWGDYSGLALDPNATQEFWAYNMYSRIAAGAADEWGTRFERFSLAADPAAGGTMSGIVFEDANGDGVRQAGEGPLAGWTLYIDANNNDTRDANEPTSVTNLAGQWQFAGYAEGFYTIREEVVPGWRQTAPSNGGNPPVQEFSIYLTDANDFAAGREFGNRRLPRVMQRQFRFEMLPIALDFQFSADVSASLELADLVVQNLTTQTQLSPVAVSYDPNTNTATFAFAGVLPNGNYRATLAAANVTDAVGDILDQDEIFDFFFLNGDANRDRIVNRLDLDILAMNWQQNSRTFSQGDFSYDTRVNARDLLLLASNWQLSWPAPLAMSGIATPTPTTFAARPIIATSLLSAVSADAEQLLG
ncbi:ELWxxDGT repeat protein [Fontivita pretiosa]|uniref:ELWxxDGT repeat protein n=1 Tax=Fontivita pretiosa TaxID=2989684 RepID=UPI003D163AFC